jgi:hypothetical protein
MPCGTCAMEVMERRRRVARRIILCFMIYYLK